MEPINIYTKQNVAELTDADLEYISVFIGPMSATTEYERCLLAEVRAERFARDRRHDLATRTAAARNR